MDSDHSLGVWILWIQTIHMESGYCGFRPSKWNVDIVDVDHLLGMLILWIRPFICSLDIVDSDHLRGGAVAWW